MNLAEIRQELEVDMNDFVNIMYSKTPGLVWLSMYKEIAEEHQNMTIEDIFDKYNKLSIHDSEFEDVEDFLLYKSILADYLTDLIDDELDNQQEFKNELGGI